MSNVRLSHPDSATGAVETPPAVTGAAPGPVRSRASGWWRRRWLRWLLVIAAVVLLILLAAGTLTSTLGAQQADDPSSVTRSGAAAVTQLLRDQGVELTRTEDAGAAVDAATRAGTQAGTQGATVVVVHPERLSPTQLRQLIGAGPGPVVLIRPDRDTLTGLGLNAGPDAVRSVPDTLLQPGCTDPVALRAGAINLPDHALAYTLPGATGCYPTAAGGFTETRVEVDGTPIIVWGAPPRNETLAQQGDAAFATGLLGSRGRVIWLMSRTQSDPGASGSRLLPGWWTAAGVQAVLGVAVLGLWRGRRFGPVIVEKLPVVVRAAETLEGHGRLYHRLSARDRAAEALRAGVRRRLGPRFGQAGQEISGSTDTAALAAAVAARTGRDPRQVQAWLNGPAPLDDDHLVQLAHDLDRLEQEAQQL